MPRSQIQEDQGRDPDFLSEAEFDAAKSNDTPIVASGSGASGSSPDISRKDHVHPVNDLGDLGDVVITSPQDGQVLTYNDGQGDWRNVVPEAEGDHDIHIIHAGLGTGRPYWAEISGTSFTTIAQFLFRGIDILQKAAEFKIIAMSAGPGGTVAAFRIYDTTNSNVVVSLPTLPQIGISVPTTWTAFTNTDFTNFPNGEAIWELQARVPLLLSPAVRVSYAGIWF